MTRSGRSLRSRPPRLPILRRADIILWKVALLAVFGIIVYFERRLNQRADFLSVSTNDTDRQLRLGLLNPADNVSCHVFE
jgi:hypothetical protein